MNYEPTYTGAAEKRAIIKPTIDSNTVITLKYTTKLITV